MNQDPVKWSSLLYEIQTTGKLPLAIALLGDEGLRDAWERSTDLRAMRGVLQALHPGDRRLYQASAAALRELTPEANLYNLASCTKLLGLVEQDADDPTLGAALAAHRSVSSAGDALWAQAVLDVALRLFASRRRPDGLHQAFQGLSRRQSSELTALLTDARTMPWDAMTALLRIGQVAPGRLGHAGRAFYKVAPAPTVSELLAYAQLCSQTLST